MNTLRILLVGLSATYLGLITGVFWIYGNAIMPGLGRTDDETFVAAFQSIDRRIINPMFLQAYFGALLVTGLAAVLAWSTPASFWTVVAFVLYLATCIITGGVNVPANDRIKAAGDPGGRAQEIRADFDEPKWLRWNRIRTWTTLTAFVSALWALILL